MAVQVPELEFGSTGEAVGVMRSAARWLAGADYPGLPAETLAEVLAGMEQVDAAQAAIRAGRSWYKASVRLVTPLRPASSDSQVDGTSAPTGVIAPSPVTTTFVRSVTVFLSGLRALPASQVPHRCGLWPSQADAVLRLT